MNTETSTNLRFFIHTLGCKVNQYESQAMREILLKAGFKESISKEAADIYIINTCTVTYKADSESRYWATQFHRISPKAKIILAGCGVEKDAGRLSFLPGVSDIVKNEDKSRIAEILSDVSVPGPRSPVPGLSITDFKDHEKAFVKIQDGCSNFCAYCKVPSVRGMPRSKPLKNIIEEISALVANGFKEIILTGICLGAWGSELSADIGLVDVLETIDGIPGNFRIRLSSIEPKYVTGELIDHIAKDNRLCKHLHMPIQSGDDEILSKMNRPYTAVQLRSIIIKVRDKIPGVGITTDVLVGFPGETDRHCWNTVNFIKDMLLARTHIFPFSKREGTVAYSMSGAIPDDEIRKRFQRMKTAATTASYLYREKFLNKSVEVLVESKRDKRSGHLTGYSDNYIKVMFDGPDSLMKNIVPVKIEELNLTCALGSVFS